MLGRRVRGDSGRVLRGGAGSASGLPEINRTELIRHYTLTSANEAFVRRFRTGRNVLGAAVRLCTLTCLGFVPDEVPSVPAAAVGRLSQRLIATGELRGYGGREQTRTDHLRKVGRHVPGLPGSHRQQILATGSRPRLRTQTVMHSHGAVSRTTPVSVRGSGPTAAGSTRCAAHWAGRRMPPAVPTASPARSSSARQRRQQRRGETSEPDQQGVAHDGRSPTP